jgi:cellulose synthase/poly-beta-1,6-N-acetylglucosamine synthase-like glycosyltransferase
MRLPSRSAHCVQNLSQTQDLRSRFFQGFHVSFRLFQNQMVLSHYKSGDVATKKSMMASISVIIPVYNGEQYIRETLESVFAQADADYEIVCVDDGSKDASLTILNEYRNRITVIQQANTGHSGARNAGAKTGIGKYLAFLDHDDRW